LRKVLVNNERYAPLKEVEVEMYDVATGRTVATAKTDAAGTAEFADIEDNGTYHFRPKVTRVSGKSGEKPLSGNARIFEL
jgi:hypothetical protein